MTAEVSKRSGIYMYIGGVLKDLVTQILSKITFSYEVVARKLDFVQSKLQISICKYRATVA